MDDIKKFININPENIELAVAEDKTIVVRLRGPEKELGFAPGFGMMMLLSPAEARKLSQSLIRMADEAEEGLSH